MRLGLFYIIIFYKKSKILKRITLNLGAFILVCLFYAAIGEAGEVAILLKWPGALADVASHLSEYWMQLEIEGWCTFSFRA